MASESGAGKASSKALRPELDQTLKRQGFALQASVDIASLPFELSEALPDAALAFTHLLVFGHAGPTLWIEAQSRLPDTDNPLDDYCSENFRDYLNRSAITEYKILYPTDPMSVDLRGLGRYLGWQHDSPLGIGVHPEFGLWFGYRGVVAANAMLGFSPIQSSDSPCQTCIDKPCISACPAGAVGDSFDLIACGDQRTTPDSDCALQCAARLACPVGAQYRYETSQIHYHGAVSLRFLNQLS